VAPLAPIKTAILSLGTLGSAWRIIRPATLLFSIPWPITNKRNGKRCNQN
jgi:hypothetical protein